MPDVCCAIRAVFNLVWLKNENMAERATKRRAEVPHQDDSGPRVGRCHCLGWLGMMGMAVTRYADLGQCGRFSVI